MDARERLSATPLRVRPGPFALAAWEVGTGLPGLEGFGFLVCDDWETTALVLEEDLARFPEPMCVEPGFSVLTLDAPMAWDVVGVLALATEALASAGIPAGACAAFSRDHLLVPAARLADARAALAPLCSIAQPEVASAPERLSGELSYHGPMPRLTEVRARSGHRLWLHYDDGAEGEVDLSHLVGRGVFAAWDTPGVFEAVRIEPHGAVAWDDEIELCSDALYLQLTGRAAEDLFPRIKQSPADA